MAAAAAGVLVVAASGTGATYAAFSDFDVVADNQVRAARVALGVPGVGAGPELGFTGLLPGVAETGSFQVSYVGSIPADVALEVRPQGGSAYCDPVGASWVPKAGGSVQISFDGATWLDYCGLLGSTIEVPVQSGVAPGADLTVPVSVQLAPGTDYRYSQLSDTDRLTVTARQSSIPDGGFTDFAVGSITIGTGQILPVVPAECGVKGGGWTITYGTPGADEIDAGNGKSIVFGLGGDDTITGSNGKDCLIGGYGDDVLVGGNGPDVLIGGGGTDTCTGDNGPVLIQCELPEPLLAPLSITEELSPDVTDEPAVPDGPPTEEAGSDAEPSTEPEPPAEPGTPDQTDTGETEPEEPAPPAQQELPPGEEPAGNTS